MNFIPLHAYEMTESFFKGICYAVWNTHGSREDFHFLDFHGKWYVAEHSDELDELFPVIKNLNWSMHGWEDWTWYYMGKRKGGIFVHEYILNKYKNYAGIKDKFMEHVPNYDAAEKALKKLKLTCAEKVLRGWVTNYYEIDYEYIAEYIAEYIEYIPPDYYATEKELKELRIEHVYRLLFELDES